ncbi:hypothetical protein WA026_012353 [Henosepilachna vigintioctopunctata]|uniref:Uncharacterized protein n=1 Tax=Henosepilachna vigintioctopunctata TaxID=420089 RepID=A0AAW1UXH3_9CUCU
MSHKFFIYIFPIALVISEINAKKREFYEKINFSDLYYLVSFQKNSSYHSKIARTSYKALFGEDPKLGLSSTYLSKNIISKLENVEDLQKLIEEINNNNSEKHQEDNTEQNSEKDQEEEEQQNANTINISKIDTMNIEQEENITAASHEIIMLEQINIENNPENIYKVSEAHTCTKCKQIVQAICGVVSEEAYVLCNSRCHSSLTCNNK